MLLNLSIGIDMNGVILALGKEVFIGGRASTEMVEEGLARHDVLRHVGTFDGLDFSRRFSLLHCDDFV